jgi:hypothetical protein
MRFYWSAAIANVSTLATPKGLSPAYTEIAGSAKGGEALWESLGVANVLTLAIAGQAVKREATRPRGTTEHEHEDPDRAPASGDHL